MDLISPLLMNGELLKDIKEAEKDHTSFHLWWLGQSGFLIQWKGKHLLIDPYLSDSLTRKYANTDKPHVRMTELIIDPVHLDFINVVTSSHNHTDHLDAETLIPGSIPVTRYQERRFGLESRRLAHRWHEAGSVRPSSSVPCHVR